ncbi:hypothetical protein [Chryseobacterium sp. Marseille-Q3244]|uniref:hypothetical protein n=1 Tax=Chryseobacterium sp. Marseille-Q3244 TaxID=2758092 RepID=UPI002024954A|nr:hypothetical protein [Chryseobacterium sp. Marseille-Q3244]
MERTNNQSGESIIKPKVLIQPGYATGDMFAIAAALIDDDELHVVISKGDENCNDPTDKADSIKKFYEDSRIAEKRIHLVEVSKLRENEEELNEKVARFQVIGRIDYGTDYVARKFSKSMKRKVRNAWKVNSCNGEDKAIEKWLTEKGIPITGGRLLILWSRFSGKNGDIHIEHDTSYFGIRQIVKRAVNMYDGIIITGDKGYQEERREKDLRSKRDSKKRGHQFDEIANEVNASKVFNITEFWNDENSNDLPKWDGNTRVGQFKLYEYFQNNFKDVKHLGFRSGNLEVMAMLGYQVRYMEEGKRAGDESKGGYRMTAWNDRRESLMDKSIPEDERLTIGYERIQLIDLPTRTGKFLQDKKLEINSNAIDKDAIDEEVRRRISVMDEKARKNFKNTYNKELKEVKRERIKWGKDEVEKWRRPDFTPGNKGGAQKPDEIRDKYLRGFNDTDLDILFNQYLRPADWNGIEDRIIRQEKHYSKEHTEGLDQNERNKLFEELATQPS